jgi:hypothetical protein
MLILLILIRYLRRTKRDSSASVLQPWQPRSTPS